jgi:hypothetical protein
MKAHKVTTPIYHTLDHEANFNLKIREKSKSMIYMLCYIYIQLKYINNKYKKQISIYLYTLQNDGQMMSPMTSRRKLLFMV